MRLEQIIHQIPDLIQVQLGRRVRVQHGGVIDVLAAPLQERTGAPAELCSLIHRMLAKDPSLRPGSIEIRQVARALGQKLVRAQQTPEYDAYELHTDGEPGARAATSRPASPPPPVWTGDGCELDPDALELGITQLEMTAIVRKPRWTPEIGYVPSGAMECGNNHAHAHARADTGVAGSPSEALTYDVLPHHQKLRRTT